MKSKPRVAFLISGGPGSAMGERSEAFASRLAGDFECTLIHRIGGKFGGITRMYRQLKSARPDVCYVMDHFAPGVIAAGLYRSRYGTPFVIDTGDSIVDLGRVLGRGFFGIIATKALEKYGFSSATEIVVRGTFHKELLGESGIDATVIPDGVSVEQFAIGQVIRRDEKRELVIGVVGNSVWIPQRKTCYGWELTEVVSALRGRLPLRVKGVLIGDGTGIEVLQRRVKELDIEGDIEFAGRIPYGDLPEQLNRFDICLTTQSNDNIGKVRTTGKLPLYLAAGKFILASRVGEASRVLPSEMLVDYNGGIDVEFPKKLAMRIEELLLKGTDFGYQHRCVDIARANFEYNILAPKVAEVLDRVISGKSKLR